VDGGIQLRLDMAVPYTGRAMSGVTCLFLARDGFEQLLAAHPTIARRWLSNAAQRLAASQARILALLDWSLTAEAARLLAEEAVDGGAQPTLSSRLVEVLPEGCCAPGGTGAAERIKYRTVTPGPAAAAAAPDGVASGPNVSGS
jgi:CRP-like cAMP-binding protein